MCTVNHGQFTKPGYLIDVKMESIAAPGALLREYWRIMPKWGSPQLK